MTYLSTTQVQAYLGLSAMQVRRLCASGWLKAHRVGGVWMIEDSARNRERFDTRPKSGPKPRTLPGVTLLKFSS